LNSPLQSYAHLARKHLLDLQTGTSRIEACALVTSDGLLIASVLTNAVDSDRFGAMCASLLALASRTAQEIQRGVLRQIILDGDGGPVLLTRVGSNKVLAVAAASGANLGLVIHGARRTASALAVLGD
jgi:predicted regulator of Ras-like GTPase activity (Roadblock/LC7/MglB family)